MNPSATFRPATVADIPAMSRIRLAVRENTLADPARITQQMYLDYLERLGRGWVAELHGEIAGFCYADSQDASIWALFIAPEHEGRGCAKRLLALAVDWLFELGNDEVRLSTAANTRADRFYAAQGWIREAESGATDVRYRVRKAPAGPAEPGAALTDAAAGHGARGAESAR